MTFILAGAGGLCGCAVLVGNVKPVDQKSITYGVMDLSKEDPNWNSLLPVQTRSKGVTPSEVSDVAFQSKKTASTISLTSGCRAGNESPSKDLREFSQPLFSSLTKLRDRKENARLVQNVPALETTAHGVAEGQDLVIRTVVLRKKSCVYDLTLVSLARFFVAETEAFSKFVESLRLKE